MKHKKLIATLVATASVCSLCGFCGFCTVMGGWYASAASVLGLPPITFDPTRVAEDASTIARYDAPPNYRTESINVFGDIMIGLSPSNGSKGPTFRLYPAREKGSVVDAETVEFARLWMKEQGYLTTSLASEIKRMSIRGERVPVLVVDGFQDDKLVYRFLIARFTARNGEDGCLEAHSPAPDWDENLVNTFIASLR